MATVEGFFVGWDGKARRTLDPGRGYVCETDVVWRCVAVVGGNGALVHEGPFFRDLGDTERDGIKAPLVSGAEPWGRPRGDF